jgi:hypothetical protein
MFIIKYINKKENEDDYNKSDTKNTISLNQSNQFYFSPSPSQLISPPFLSSSVSSSSSYASTSSTDRIREIGLSLLESYEKEKEKEKIEIEMAKSDNLVLINMENC